LLKKCAAFYSSGCDECAVIIFRSVSSLVAQLRSWFSLLAEQQRTAEEQLQLAARQLEMWSGWRIVLLPVVCELWHMHMHI
jgi:hypothetical protein